MPELCQGSFYTEVQAVELHKAVAAQYKDQVSWEKRAQLIRQGIFDGAEIKQLSHKNPKTPNRSFSNFRLENENTF